MTAVTVHVTVGIRDAPLAHGDCHLVERFGQGSPEIPVVFSTAQVGAGITMDDMVKVWKFKRGA